MVIKGINRRESHVSCGQFLLFECQDICSKTEEIHRQTWSPIVRSSLLRGDAAIESDGLAEWKMVWESPLRGHTLSLSKKSW